MLPWGLTTTLASRASLHSSRSRSVTGEALAKSRNPTSHLQLLILPGQENLSDAEQYRERENMSGARESTQGDERI